MRNTLLRSLRSTEPDRLDGPARRWLPAPRAKAHTPPKGFTALFNGKDLTGWHGMPHFDPYKLAAMPEDERKAQIEKWTDGRQEALDGRERRTGQRRQGRLPDHRQGLRRHRAADRLQDRRPRPTAASTCGPRRRCRSGTTPRKAASGTSAPTRAAAACGTTAPAPRARTRWSWPTSRSASGTSFRILMVGERVTVYLNDKLVVDHARLENFWNRKLPLPEAGPDPAPDARRRDPLAEPLHPRDSRRRGQRDPAQARRRRASRTSSTARTSPAGPARSTSTRSRTAPSSAGRSKGGTIYTKEEYADFVARVEYQAAARRQQRPGHPLSRQGRHGLRRHVRGAGARRHRPAVRQARPAAVQRLGLRHGRRRTAATCGRSASGTSRR